MKIRDLYSRVETEKQSKLLLALSIIAPTILLIFVMSVAIYITQNALVSKERRQIGVVSEAVAALAFWDEKTSVAEDVSDCKVFYYRNLPTGEVVNPEEGFAMNYTTAIDGEKVDIKGQTYLCKCGKITMGNEQGLYYYIVYLDISADKHTMNAVIWSSIGVFLIAFAVLFAVTYALVMLQMGVYEQAIDRNNRLVSDISHEFNTPLAVIKSSMQQIMTKPDEKVEDISESLVTVTHEAGRLSRMVKDMLVLSRSDSERLIIEKTNCDITEIVREVVEPFQMMCELDNKEMIIDLEEDIKSRTDGDKLKQAIIILLDNATKYTQEGETITVRLFATFSKYIIEVADTGEGVPDGELQNIFERFYRTDTSRTQATGGSGLGLSIVKAVMTALKGKVYASHNDPKGLVITLELPKEKFTQNLQSDSAPKKA